MAKVSARLLAALGPSVGHGDPIPLPISQLDLVKIQICQELERLFGDDVATQIRVLKRLQTRNLPDVWQKAVEEVLAGLEKTKS